MDTNIGKLEFVLTQRQLERLHLAAGANIKAITILSSNHVILTHINPLTQDQIDLVKSKLQTLSDDPLPVEVEKTEIDKIPFINMDHIQFGNWVDNNVTDLASARSVIKNLGKIILKVARKIGV